MRGRVHPGWEWEWSPTFSSLNLCSSPNCFRSAACHASNVKWSGSCNRDRRGVADRRPLGRGPIFFLVDGIKWILAYPSLRSKASEDDKSNFSPTGLGEPTLAADPACGGECGVCRLQLGLTRSQRKSTKEKSKGSQRWVPQPAPACRGVSRLRPGILLANAHQGPCYDPRLKQPIRQSKHSLRREP